MSEWERERGTGSVTKNWNCKEQTGKMGYWLCTAQPVAHWCIYVCCTKNGDLGTSFVMWLEFIIILLVKRHSQHNMIVCVVELFDVFPRCNFKTKVFLYRYLTQFASNIIRRYLCWREHWFFSCVCSPSFIYLVCVLGFWVPIFLLYITHVLFMCVPFSVQEDVK